MDEHAHHEELISGLKVQLKEIFENSEQGIYIYLDDNHKACNKKFSDMLGYGSEEEWSKVEGSFPDEFADESSRESLVSAYGKAMEKLIASKIDIKWKTKSGETILTEVILVPIAFEGHLFALHFVSTR